jgi:hypothetical protein
MGYYMEQVESNFTIKKENIQKAWDSLIELFKVEKKSVCDSSGYHYSWIDTKSVLNAKTFQDAMDEARWSVEISPLDGDVCEIWFNGEKYGGDETIILGSIAPYVEDGSYIIMQGENGERWKWKFIEGVIKEVYGHFVFNDEE